MNPTRQLVSFIMPVWRPQARLAPAMYRERACPARLRIGTDRRRRWQFISRRRIAGLARRSTCERSSRTARRSIPRAQYRITGSNRIPNPLRRRRRCGGGRQHCASAGTHRPRQRHNCLRDHSIVRRAFARNVSSLRIDAGGRCFQAISPGRIRCPPSFDAVPPHHHRAHWRMELRLRGVGGPRLRSAGSRARARCAANKQSRRFTGGIGVRSRGKPISRLERPLR